MTCGGIFKKNTQQHIGILGFHSWTVRLPISSEVCELNFVTVTMSQMENFEKNFILVISPAVALNIFSL